MPRLGSLFLLAVACSCAGADSAQIHKHAIPCESHPETTLCVGAACVSHSQSAAADMHSALHIRAERSSFAALKQTSAPAAFDAQGRRAASVQLLRLRVPIDSLCFPAQRGLSSVRSRAPPSIG